MRRLVVTIFVITLGAISLAVGIGRGEQPKEDYFDQWVFLMPDNVVTRLPRECLVQSNESYYNPLEQHYYCPNFADNIRTVYVSLESSVVDYISFRPLDLRYGDLIAIYGQPTNITILRGRISSIQFGSIYVIIQDRRLPIDYESRVLTIGFTDAFRRNR